VHERGSKSLIETLVDWEMARIAPVMTPPLGAPFFVFEPRGHSRLIA
jgi:hypothetical protein